MSKLSQVVESMETTRQSNTDPLRQLRHWRLQATLRYMSVIVKASKPVPATRPGR